MAVSLDNKLVVAISSRALFNFEEENALFESGDAQAYMKLQLERLDVPAAPGHRVLADQEAAGLQRHHGAAGGSGDPLAQRPGVGHAHLPLRPCQRAQARARRLHPGPRAVPLPAAAARPPVPFGQCRRRARGAGRRLSGGAGADRVGAGGQQLPQRSAHRLRRRRGAVLGRSRARVPDAGARRLPAARVEQGRAAAARRPLQAAAGGAAPAAAGRHARRCASAPRW